ncbi:MAG: M48 family metallopeptidase [Calditrichaeota bacterium]|nr:M48 family metallopeptidase [Calditrichota bacterium]
MTNRAKAYNRIKLVLSLIELAFTLGFLGLLSFGGFSEPLARLAREVTEQPYLQFIVFLFLLGAIQAVYGLPLSFYGGYLLEHRFGLSNQTLFQWIWQRTKGALVGLVIGLPLLLTFYFLLRHHPETWWFWLGVVLFGVMVLLARVAPVLIFPLFYKFTPLDNPELKTRLEKLLQPYGFHLEGLYRFNLSKDTRKANAAFMGMSRSKRIALSDTLLDEFEPGEIEYVVAHEVGHFYLKHLIKQLVLHVLVTFVGLYLVHVGYSAYVQWKGYSTLASLEALPFLALLMTLHTLGSAPVVNAFSRKHEFEADRFAVQASGQFQAAKSALQKLAKMNLSDEHPHPVVEFMFYTHPSIPKRIQAIETIEKEKQDEAASV